MNSTFFGKYFLLIFLLQFCSTQLFSFSCVRDKTLDKLEQSITREELYLNIEKVLLEVAQNQNPEGQKQTIQVLRHIKKLGHECPILIDYSWRSYRILICYLTRVDGFTSSNQEFKKSGFASGEIDSQLNQNLLTAMQEAKPIPFAYDDIGMNYLCNSSAANFEEIYNQCHEYYFLERKQLEALEAILQDIQDEIQSCYCSPWKVFNVKCWKTYANTFDRGAQMWHLDGLPGGAIKIMLYLNGPSRKKGTIEIMQFDGTPYLFQSASPSWFFFQSNFLVHRGVPPKEGKRLAIEVTIAPSREINVKSICEGYNAQVPKTPWYKPEKRELAGDEIYALNLGGEPDFYAEGWLNLNEIFSDLNQNPFQYYSNCRFPVKDINIEKIQISRLLEYSNIPTVYRILSEAFGQQDVALVMNLIL